MGNMSYCRFTNTLADLQDCYNHLDDSKEQLEKEGGMSEEEYNNRKELIKLCCNIAEDYGDEV